jgi:hypothetical protein
MPGVARVLDVRRGLLPLYAQRTTLLPSGHFLREARHELEATDSHLPLSQRNRETTWLRP